MTADCQEQTVVYKIFSSTSYATSELESLRQKCAEFLAPWVLSYPWYKQRFYLDFPPEKCNTSHVLFMGSVDFGESIEDEWFIVWLLRELSRHFTDLLIQINDEDGEFLLIEVADCLPDWIDPDNSANRVWLRKGNLDILDFDYPNRISLIDALNELRKLNAWNHLCQNARIQKLLDRRIKEYPDKITEVEHTSHVLLPYPAAALLSLSISSTLLSSAVEELSNRCYDKEAPDRRKPDSHRFFSMGFFPNIDSPHCSWQRLQSDTSRYVLRPCTFNKTLYARLRSLPTPSVSHHPRASASSAERLALELGIKLCAGLDALISKSISPGPDLLATPEDHSFMDAFEHSPSAAGYFKSSKPGTKQHDDLLTFAHLYFIPYNTRQSHFSKDPYNWATLNPNSAMSQLLDAIEARPQLVLSFEEMLNDESNLRLPDSESWMYVTPEELDSLLLNYNQGGVDSGVDQGITVADKLDRFVNSTSSFEGVELPTKKSTVNKREHSTSSDSSSTDSDDFPHSLGEGYDEGPAVKTPSEALFTMADMMSSILESAGQSSANRDTRKMAHRKTSQWIDGYQRNSCSSNEDLDACYVSGSDALNDYDDLLNPKSTSKLGDTTSSLQTNGTKPDVKQNHRTPNSSADVFPKASKSSDFPDSSSDEEPTARDVNWYNKIDQNASRDSSDSSPNDFSYADYIAAMEEELATQPANIGRFHKTVHTKQSNVGKKLIPQHKKVRHTAGMAATAQPEEESDSGTEQETAIPSEVPSTSSSMAPELAAHVTKNLCASVLPEFGSASALGPSAMLLGSLGLPVHQLSAAVTDTKKRVDSNMAVQH